ncbi:hypothetical protein LSTR_LSTR016171 [Laodelphax striatellus]|uniref:Uncharacterized protein n=1 Tax=Laodelphax striatellus TaxID=195883 RepID=A0A482XE30_LAOST|nr:hypothetical protein LSTR_LSTR016171 [Laodelphax striatellus]
MERDLLQNDEAVIEALVAVLCSEEEAVGLQQPTGIGAKPLLINNQENKDCSPHMRLAPRRVRHF